VDTGAVGGGEWGGFVFLRERCGLGGRLVAGLARSYFQYRAAQPASTGRC
jgi:hypothetical protein